MKTLKLMWTLLWDCLRHPLTDSDYRWDGKSWHVSQRGPRTMSEQQSGNHSLDELARAIERYLRRPLRYDLLDDGKTARIWFNNEYPIDLSLDVVLSLWPEAQKETTNE